MKGLAAIIVAVGASVCLVTTAGAVAGNGDNNGGGKNKGPQNARAACVVKCVREMGACVSKARVDFRVCRQECADERAAVRAACHNSEGTEPSEECRAAVAALELCMGKCHEDFKTALKLCQEKGRACVKACVKPEPSPSPSTGLN